jgi:hypothetical protein
MTLGNDIELANTRCRLRELEQRYQARLARMPANPHVHQLTLQSLKRMINQLKEEIALFETQQSAGGKA